MGVFIPTMSGNGSPFGQQPWDLWLEHAIVLFGAGYVLGKLCQGGLINNLIRLGLKGASVIPGAKQLLEKEQAAAIRSIEDMVFEGEPDLNIMEEIPDEGLNAERVLEILQSWRDKEIGYQAGKSFGGIYTDYKNVEEVEKGAMVMYCGSNGLYPTTFPGLRKVEAEVVRMACTLLHGDAESCGTMTSGGTESILCAMKTYRDRGEAMGIREPEAIVPESAHAAFIKGAHFFGIKLIYAKVGPDYRVDVADIKRHLSRNTVMVVGSAPTFPHGVIDPIEEIAALLADHPHIGLHVDACLGGFILPWVERAGRLKRRYDFAISRVTSISADLHKYGFAPKGASVILYRNKDIRKYQYFSYCDWSGGLYCSPAVQGSRAGGPMAGAWAVFVHMGKNGFEESTRHYLDAYDTVVNGIKTTPGLRLMSDCDGCVVAYTSDEVDIYKVGDAMLERGWTVNRMQRPRCLNIQIGSRKNFDAAGYVQALRESVEDVKQNPAKYEGGMAGIYGMAATLADARSVQPLEEILSGYMDALYLTRPSSS